MTDSRPLPAWVDQTPDGAVLRVRVSPRAGRTGVAGERAGVLHIRLAAAPIEGAANAALVKLLADSLRVPSRALEVVAGDRTRDKRVRVRGLGAAEVARRLSPVSARS